MWLLYGFFLATTARSEILLTILLWLQTGVVPALLSWFYWIWSCWIGHGKTFQNQINLCCNTRAKPVSWQHKVWSDISEQIDIHCMYLYEVLSHCVRFFSILCTAHRMCLLWYMLHLHTMTHHLVLYLCAACSMWLLGVLRRSSSGYRHYDKCHSDGIHRWVWPDLSAVLGLHWQWWFHLGMFSEWCVIAFMSCGRK